MDKEGFREEFLETHNNLRKMHKAPALKYSSELNAAAQKWAEHLLSQENLAHSKTENGENVFFMSSSQKVEATGKEAVESWYSEIKDYDWNNPSYQSNTGHFTQVVWESSTHLGVGVATNGKMLFVVGQYSPAGNVCGDGYFEKNVHPKTAAGGDAAAAVNTSSKETEVRPKKKKTCTLL